MRQSAYYREPFAEAYALQHLGPGFLDDFRAYNDFRDGRATPRLLEWMDKRGVTLLYSHGKDFNRALERFAVRLEPLWPYPMDRIANGVYRIRPPPGSEP